MDTNARKHARLDPIRTPKTMKHLEMLHRLAKGEAPPPPVAHLIGFVTREFDLGYSVLELQARPDHMNPMGTMHGGIIVDLADAAMGLAMATTLEDDEAFTTIDLSANFFKPIRTELLRAVGRVVRRTRTLGLVECDVEDDTGSFVAKTYSTCMVLRGEKAQGREVPT